AARLLEADAAVELGGGVRREDEVVAHDAAVVTDLGRAAARVVAVRATVGALAEAEADAARAVADGVALDDRVAAAGPDVDAVLGEAGAAPEADDEVVAQA